MKSKLISLCQEGPKSAAELIQALGISSRARNFRQALRALMADGLVEMTLPEQPKSKHQKYRYVGGSR